MPELIEVEAYRELAEQALERKIVEVVAPDAWWLKGGLSADVLSDALVGRHFLAARRTGKRMMLDTSDHGPVLGLKFGMTGRLLVDGHLGVEKLEYSSNREVEAWEEDRNERGVEVKWQFTTADARIKLQRLYPSLQ